ncbi:MAG: hypothetical protein DRG82_12320 [Deltaproteobacteria bacterium]|nr:MAG: hypothetical protein DRG82_12320 [Deltaproteobacteria bacterium]
MKLKNIIEKILFEDIVATTNGRLIYPCAQMNSLAGGNLPAIYAERGKDTKAKPCLCSEG